ncbi:hypothetical protein [Streptomyces sp. AC550_RSS872]|uniref:hypothetical protein n=1 Tax=Streptomyces sp. AC550_RSS872 TaxID=2823689 RepID=UPI001C2549A3|nr:hypothetical protein [Streptomyces sp. AC550_RSS872]
MAVGSADAAAALVGLGLSREELRLPATALSATGRYRDVLVTAGPSSGCTAVPD